MNQELCGCGADSEIRVQFDGLSMLKKRIPTHKKPKGRTDELQAEYRFDYRKARPNRFAASYKAGSHVVVLDPDIAKAFTTPESVNAVLRALLDTMPRKVSGK